MSYRTKFFIFSILLAVAGQALASRGNPKTNQNNNGDMKQPEWLVNSDPSVLIPGIGRVMVPPAFSNSHPYFGSGSGTGTVGNIPGGDDTFLPSPGYDVPTPSTPGGGIPPVTQP